MVILYNRIKGSEPHIFEQSQAVAIPFLPERTNRPHNIIFNQKIQNFYCPEQTKQKLILFVVIGSRQTSKNWPSKLNISKRNNPLIKGKTPTTKEYKEPSNKSGQSKAGNNKRIQSEESDWDVSDIFNESSDFHKG
jgi:hypothetical protein